MDHEENIALFSKTQLINVRRRIPSRTQWHCVSVSMLFCGKRTRLICVKERIDGACIVKFVTLPLSNESQQFFPSMILN